MKKFFFDVTYTASFPGRYEDTISVDAETMGEAIQKVKDKFNEDGYNIINIE